MTRSTIIVLSLFTGILHVACNQNTTSIVEVKHHFILPLAVGNTWLYRVEFYDPDSTLTRFGFDTSTVFSDTIVNGVKWYLTSPFGYVTNKSDGFYSSFYTPLLEFKYPAMVGDSNLYDSFHDRVRIVESVSETVSVVGKVLNAVKYKEYSYSQPLGEVYEFYMVPNIGEVKLEITLSVVDSPRRVLWLRRQLVSYVIK